MKISTVTATAVAAAVASMSIYTAAAAGAPAPSSATISREEPIAPKGAPNVLVILGDDVGFSMNSTFGGAVPTPNTDALAAQGIRFNRFHTTAQCSPTRAALLTGRNPHRVNIGSITDIAVNDPGFTTIIPKSAATVGRVLQMNGYSTAWFGKDHITPQWDLTAAGPFDRWPTGLGFDYFYGFLGGDTDQFHPALYENTTPVPTPDRPGYILDHDLIDHAIEWIRSQASVAPGKPFFVYLATGTVHAPQEAFPEWIAKFRGKFDQGWDKLREETYARQKAEHIIPPDARLTPRPPSLPAWDSLTPDQQRIASRTMEVAAAQSAYFDDQLGRLFAALKAGGQWDNTLIIYVNGDNGAAHVGGPLGSPLLGPGRTVSHALSVLDQMGSDRHPTLYNAGWAWAMNTPFQYWKQMSGHLGGVRNGLTISWPGHIQGTGGIRPQFGFVTDIAPTIYEAAHINPPATVDGVRQMTLDGKSLVYTFADAAAPSRRTEQYFEINGNRGYYKNGWFAGTTPPRQMWEQKTVPPLGQWNWELYNLDADYSQSNDLAAVNPAKLAELKREYQRAEEKNGFRVKEAALARPTRSDVQPFWSNHRDRFTFYPSARRLTDQSLPDLPGRTWSVEAKLEVLKGATDGAIINQGGLEGGWGLYVVDGLPTFYYDAPPFTPVAVRAPQPLAPGSHEVGVRIVPVEPGRGRPFHAILTIDGKEVAQQKVEHALTNLPHLDVGLGRVFNAPLPDNLRPPFIFEGTIERIDLSVSTRRPQAPAQGDRAPGPR